jgi:carbamoyl-phosphate synthase small subunit
LSARSVVGIISAPALPGGPEIPAALRASRRQPPVKDLETGRIDITSQNHGFAVLGPGGDRTIEGDDPVRWQTDFGEAELSHLNLYDRTVEGLVLKDVPGCTVQYHPEAGPGPHDARYLFDRFLELARA